MIDAYSNVSASATYNVRGMRTQLADMNLGTWTFTPNALGEVVSQLDAKSQTTSFAFDRLGRLASRTEAEGTSTWTWGQSSAAKNVGRIASVTGPGYSESLTYNSVGQLATRSISTDATYAIDYAYNNIGALHTLTNPTSTGGVRFKVKYGYSYGWSAIGLTSTVDGLDAIDVAFLVATEGPPIILSFRPRRPDLMTVESLQTHPRMRDGVLQLLTQAGMDPACVHWTSDD